MNIKTIGNYHLIRNNILSGEPIFNPNNNTLLIENEYNNLFNFSIWENSWNKLCKNNYGVIYTSSNFSLTLNNTNWIDLGQLFGSYWNTSFIPQNITYGNLNGRLIVNAYNEGYYFSLFCGNIIYEQIIPITISLSISKNGNIPQDLSTYYINSTSSPKTIYYINTFYLNSGDYIVPFIRSSLLGAQISLGFLIFLIHKIS